MQLLLLIYTFVTLSVLKTHSLQFFSANSTPGKTKQLRSAPQPRGVFRVQSPRTKQDEISVYNAAPSRPRALLRP